VGEVLAELRDVSLRLAPDAAPALQALSGTIEAGRVTGLVGPDGAGKSTLLRLLTGLLVPDTGSVTVLGIDTTTAPDRIRNDLGYMPQRFGLYEDLTVQENLNLYADLRGVMPAEREHTFGELLAFSGLAPFRTRLAGRLSGGMKQKLGLACALMRRPRLLLLDEPSVGVDPISRRELWRMVGGLVEEGIGVVWSTAYLDEAERCGHVLLLGEGRLQWQGPPAQLTRRVAGRVFLLRDLADRRRRVLRDLLEAPGVRDGVVQGSALRVVMAEAGDAAAAALEGAAGAGRAEPVPPRFEDAFIDLLGGGPGGRSQLAERWTTTSFGRGAVIEALGLGKRFGDFTAATDLSFAIQPGEIFGLLGPNGAGKSTTFKMLCGLLTPTNGEGRVAGFDLRRDRAEARNHLGYMAQKFSLYGDLSVRQNLEFFARVYGLSRRRVREQVRAMTDVFDLGPLLDTSARKLPLGFQQRLALACAVMHEPEVLFLDEPTSGVDPVTRREFWTHINALVERGVAVLVTTHFMEEAEYCDRIAVIYQGHAIATGSPDALKQRAARITGRVDPTLEDAFIALVATSDLAREEAA
jgi:ABC-2 type transport system ATP-binding protein